MKSNIFDAVAELDYKLKNTSNSIYESISIQDCEFYSIVDFRIPEDGQVEKQKLMGIINGSIIIYSKIKDSNGDNLAKKYLNIQFCSLVVEEPARLNKNSVS